MLNIFFKYQNPLKNIFVIINLLLSNNYSGLVFIASNNSSGPDKHQALVKLRDNLSKATSKVSKYFHNNFSFFFDFFAIIFHIYFSTFLLLFQNF